MDSLATKENAIFAKRYSVGYLAFPVQRLEMDSGKRRAI